MIEPTVNHRATARGHIPNHEGVAAPAWMHISARPLEVALQGIGPANTLWPFGRDTAVYGVDADVHWVDRSIRNLTFAGECGSADDALVLWVDTFDLSPTPRQPRPRVDLVVPISPLRFTSRQRTARADGATLVAELEWDMRVAISALETSTAYGHDRGCLGGLVRVVMK